MDSFLFGNPWALYVGAALLMAAILYRFFWYVPSTYQYSLVHYIKARSGARSYASTILFVLRSLVLGVCVFLIARPQLADSTSQVTSEGVDIMLVLDVSGSMELFDDVQDTRSRIEVAKEEAVTFVDKRTQDPMGLVIFGAYAVSRCPLTLDKKMLKHIITDTELDTIDSNGTVISIALITAANRLRASKAKSKIIILLTDGAPTQGLDTNPEEAIAILNTLGIKVYTVGIGAENGGYIQDPFYGLRRIPSSINRQLLMKIAQETGGAFFQAERPDDMARVYHMIDQLEKTDTEAPIFTRYQDLLFPWIWVLLALVGLELLARIGIWYGVSL